ncbi:MAG: DNA repair protein RadC [Bacteroidia bacterium]
MQEYETKLSIKSWAEADRPREKLLAKGKSALSEAELIAILIGSGNTEESAVELSKRILSSVDNNLVELGKLDVNALCKFKGIGEAKAISIIAALELGRRRNEHSTPERESITTSRQAFNLLHPILADLPHEEFWLIFLNRANKVIKKQSVSKGGVSGTVVDAKMIFKPAVENLASSVILCHNHPSGNRTPSQEDIALTKKIKEAGRVLDISVHDHIIIANDTYYSFADEGFL